MVIVYTTIFGGSDSLKPAPIGADRCVCFTDDFIDASGLSNGWELVSWPARNPRREAWHLRCIPHMLFDDYSSVVWIDASFTLKDLRRLLTDSAGHDLSALRHHNRTSCYHEGRELVAIGQSDHADVSAQVETYRREGFNPDSITISCVLVRTHSSQVKSFNEMWNGEIARHLGDNTQLSLDYCAWRNDLTIHHLAGSRKDNPYAVHDHEDHKRRRKPYR